MPLVSITRGKMRRPAWLPIIFVCLWAWLAGSAHAERSWTGRPLQAVLAELSGPGQRLIFSSDLVSPRLQVVAEPVATEGLALIEELLRPHGLTLKEVGEGIFSVVRTRVPAMAAAIDQPRSDPSPPALTDVVITASRYSIVRDLPLSRDQLDQAQLAALPRLADDALRTAQRLPGASGNGVSGLAHVRGGTLDETLVMFDGLALYEPFHLRILQGPVSVVDERIVDSLDVFTGSFTADYGDRMSAIIDIRTLPMLEEPRNELGLGLFHTHALVGRSLANGRGDWLVSLRRSNLDLLADALESDLGEPRYGDAYARLAYRLQDGTSMKLSMLQAADSAQVIDPTGFENARVEYRNTYLWGTAEKNWESGWRAEATLSYSDVWSRRQGTVAEAAFRNGSVDDTRGYDVLGMRLDLAREGAHWLLRGGVELRNLSARYAYASERTLAAGYPFPGSPALQESRRLDFEPQGEHAAAYLTGRRRLGESVTAELGLRWDHQTYSDDRDTQFAPRLNVAWDVSEAWRLRLAWGRYQQFQGIEQLQVEDGIEQFHTAQYADQLVVGLDWSGLDGWTVRLEAYDKRYGQPATRFENLYDPLSLLPELRWDRVAIAPERSRSRGIELLAAYRGDSPWGGWLALSTGRAEDFIDGRWRRRAWDQEYGASLGLDWQSGPWRAAAGFLYRSGWPVTRLEVDESDVATLGPLNGDRYGDFASLDLRLSREFSLSRGRLLGFVEVSNALDRRNECCSDFSVSAAAGAIPRLEETRRHWLPLVPSLGVIWSF